MKQAPYDSTTLSILYGIISISYSECSQWVTLKKSRSVVNVIFAETALPIFMNFIGCYYIEV